MKRIRTKLLVSILAITLLPVFPLYFVVKSFFEKSLEVGFNPKVESALDNARHISQVLFAKFKKETLKEVQAIATSEEIIAAALHRRDLPAKPEVLATFTRPSRILIYDRQAKLVGTYQTPARVPYPPVYQPQLQPMLHEQHAKILDVGSSPDLISAFAPLRYRGQKVGFIIYSKEVEAPFVKATREIVEVNQMFKTLAIVREDLQRGFILAFFVVYVPIAIISLAVGYLFSKKISAPIRELARGTEQIAAGNWNYRVKLTSQDEIGRLGRSFNVMIEKIKQQQDQVVALEKMAVWREMARIMAHEIKNPLTPIQLTVQQLKDKYPGDDPAYAKLLNECTGIIIDEIKNLQKLVREFSDFARMPKPQISECNLNELIREITKLYAKAPIRLDLADDLPVLHLDAEQIKRVVMNLIENGLQSVQEKGSGELLIRSTFEKPYAAIYVKDSGTGIARELQAKIFEPYFSTKKSGMGLGLAIVKRIVEEHGGTIGLVSEEGKGAEFKLTFPVV
ncbi:MAG: HAMP domain-containing protein [Calditrichaeota bacterium]|nr:MAG: HAMP domain-containing protein [Calditrichota bacterium]